MKPITVHEAKIDTATIEVKTLVVGNRQMTLAVFKQLPRILISRIKDKPLILPGVLWGRVNACPFLKCTDIDRTPHTHCIFVVEKILYHGVVHGSIFRAFGWESSICEKHICFEGHTATGFRPYASCDKCDLEDWRALEREYARILATVESSPQLFIAV